MPSSLQDTVRADNANAHPDGLNPRKIFLFSGHRIDAIDRTEPRFPLDKTPIALEAIEKTLTSLDANNQDLALTQGASGGDLLFAETCQARGVTLQMLLPLPESEFIKQSIALSPGDWENRFYTVKQHLTLPIVTLPEYWLKSDPNPFIACNLWLLDTAASYGANRLTFICLWNGQGGDGPGGTAHMMKLVEKHGGQVIWLDTQKLW